MKYVFIVLIIGFMAFLFTKKFDEQDAKEAFDYLKSKYGIARAQLFERVMRLETAHFKSKQYQSTGTGGMEYGKWTNLPGNSVVSFVDNFTKKAVDFIKFHSVTDFAEYWSKYVDRNAGNWARWNSTDPSKQAEYRNRVNSVTNKFV